MKKKETLAARAAKRATPKPVRKTPETRLKEIIKNPGGAYFPAWATMRLNSSTDEVHMTIDRAPLNKGHSVVVDMSECPSLAIAKKLYTILREREHHLLVVTNLLEPDPEMIRFIMPPGWGTDPRDFEGVPPRTRGT